VVGGYAGVVIIVVEKGGKEGGSNCDLGVYSFLVEGESIILSLLAHESGDGVCLCRW